jgi:hypothetical protein
MAKSYIDSGKIHISYVIELNKFEFSKSILINILKSIGERNHENKQFPFAWKYLTYDRYFFLELIIY